MTGQDQTVMLWAMTMQRRPVRIARAGDVDQLVTMWATLFDEEPTGTGEWRANARTWFARVVDDPTTATIPVIDTDGRIVACAIGTLESGVPNPQSPTGRAVRLANVVTLPEHRGKGYGTTLTQAVIRWARSIDADRIDLSATPDGQRIYERAGFVHTSAPRMKLHL